MHIGGGDVFCYGKPIVLSPAKSRYFLFNFIMACSPYSRPYPPSILLIITFLSGVYGEEKET